MINLIIGINLEIKKKNILKIYFALLTPFYAKIIIWNKNLKRKHV